MTLAVRELHEDDDIVKRVRQAEEEHARKEAEMSRAGLQCTHVSGIEGGLNFL